MIPCVAQNAKTTLDLIKDPVREPFNEDTAKLLYNTW